MNKTQRPVRIALPRGKTLHLGPGGRGRIHDDALERPALKKMIEAGQVEVISDDGREGAPAAAVEKSSGPGKASTRGHSSAKSTSGKGDR